MCIRDRNIFVKHTLSLFFQKALCDSFEVNKLVFNHFLRYSFSQSLFYGLWSSQRPLASVGVNIQLSILSPNKRYQGNVDPSIQICAGHEEGGGDACQGDSGGPLIVIENGSPKMVGIMSWGIGCGRAHFYTVYTRISTFIPWMEKTISDMRVQWLLNENPILTTPAPTIGTTLHEAGQYLRSELNKIINH